MARALLLAILGFLGIVLLVGIIFCVYFLVYKRRINESLHDDKERKPMAPLHAIIPYFCFFALTLCIILSFSQIGNLNSHIASLNNHISNLNAKIESIYDELSSEKEESLLTSVDVSYGAFNVKDRTVKVTITAIPKSITGEAEVTVKSGGKAFELKNKNDGVFEGTFDVDIFEPYDYYTTVMISDDTGIRTQECDEIDLGDCWAMYLSYMTGSVYNYDLNYSRGMFKFKGNIELEIENAKIEDSVIESVHLISEINGKAVDDMDITDKLSTVEASSVIYFDLNKGYTANEDDELKIYLVTKDNLGFTHKTLMVGTGDIYDENRVISDTNGVVLWNGE